VEYTTQSASSAIQAAIAGPKFNSCMTSAFTTDAKASAPQGATPSPVAISALTAPAVGDKASATRINVSMNLGGGLVIKLYQDFIVVFKGTAIARFFFLNPGGPFAPDLEQSLLTKVVNAS
ncbi:MAG TPA: hypothetical protein VGR90_08365, partial [Acidimicrobiales bacterium]|nr:hypothetical protein [Acidimicrobiales bacterium]